MWPSVVVYTVTALILFGLGWHVSVREQKSLALGGKQLPFYSWEILLSILLFSVVAGMRYGTGFDHLMYLRQYQFCQEGHTLYRQFELGFAVFTKGLARLGFHYSIYFGLLALVQISLLYYGLNHKKQLLPWFGALLMTSWLFLYLMNTIREGIVVCLLVALVPWVQQKRYLWLVLVFLAAVLIHTSALLVIPIVFLAANVNIDKVKIQWLLLVYFACVILGQFPDWIRFLLMPLRDVTHMAGYDVYIDDINKMLSNGFRSIPWGPSNIKTFLMGIITIVFYGTLKKWTEDRYLPIYFFLFFLGLCFEALMINTNHYVLRAFDYFRVFSVILTAYLLLYLWEARRWMWFIAVAVLNFSYIYFEIFKSVHYPSSTNWATLYHFFFLTGI